MEVNIERCLRQFKAHTKTLSNGDHVVGLPGSVYDMFSGDGWLSRTRFKVVKQHAGRSFQEAKIVAISGMTMSKELELLVLREVA